MTGVLTLACIVLVIWCSANSCVLVDVLARIEEILGDGEDLK